ncbi:hypothetical protein LOTGIDRAFT_236027 [Lottia gigantea]|uniref:EF-hand domain-containing protein n=1 Tax=Lottia gigantea TaxID=225164 RepID=V4B8D3_LOTGI|nr:hypothetical protein LOTGIDRAFT_236027 [Lottia gigantea]ESO84984.1 hypothetical protein LOTGIDRAFT_236027 [Lottia gigantea]
MAVVSQNLLPMSARVGSELSERPILRTRQSISQPKTARSYRGRLERFSTSRPGFSRLEIETILREKLHQNYENIQKALVSHDVKKDGTVTRDDFRSVLTSHCFPLTSHQYDTLLTKVEQNNDGCILYLKFLEKFSGGKSLQKTSDDLLLRNNLHTPAVKDVGVENLEKMLQEKLRENLKSITKALRLFDYNFDGKIQRYEFRRVLENYCFKLTDSQFDKLWLRYDTNHTGMINYKELLQKLGFQINKLLPSNTVHSSLTQPIGLLQSEKSVDNRLRHQYKQEEQWLKKMSFEQIEQEFRKRMRSNYVNLKKSFLAFDKSLSGFINIDDLKAILTNFTIPMSNQLFTRLMERCGIRGTGRIAWEIFLEKFQNPMDSGNGQTIPIKNNHKFFPVMEKQCTVLSEDVWNQLYKSIESHYSSFRQAFLEFDINRTGKVTRKDFRRILEKFTFPLDDNQFKCVMLKLDPHHTNHVTYHQFLKLFEERDTWEGHKWLNSVHRFNEKQKPIIMAWGTVEDILREKIVENWRNVSDAIIYYDHSEEGFISPTNLKRVLNKYVLPISDEHFHKLVSNCKSLGSDAKVNYIEFLENLKVEVSPGDLCGLSSQIYAGSKVAEHVRHSDHINRQLVINKRLEERTNFLSAEEVIAKLQDRLSQHNTLLYQAFNSFDKTGKGKISKRNFRRLLYNMGFVMSDEQFQELVTKLQFSDGFMSYKNFINNFENRNGQEVDIIRTGNHHVNPIRGDEFGFKAQEVENRLRTKLRDNFPDLRSAFYKFDNDHDGVLIKINFRDMLDYFMIVTSDEEYEILCQRLGIDKFSKLTYQDFLDKFEIRDTEAGHKWLKSVHRYNQTIPPRKLTAEETHEELKIKAHRQWADLAKAFLGFDRKKKGVIRKNELRNVLNRFMISNVKEEFDKLWKMYDEDEKGYVSYQDFLNKLGSSEFTPIDEGTSQNIIDGSRQTLLNHNLQQHYKHEDTTLKQAELGMLMTAEEVEKLLRDKVRDKYKDFYTAFRNYDSKKRGYLSINEIQRVLVDLNIFLNEEEFFRLLDRIGLHTNQSKLNYEDFLKAFEEGRKSSYGTRKTEEFNFVGEDNSNLSPEDAEDKLSKIISSQKYTLEKACASFDKDNAGMISVNNLRRVIDTFCFKLTNKQWTHFINKFTREPDNIITYRVFLDHFSPVNLAESKNWMSMLKKSALVSNDAELVSMETTPDSVEEKLKESVVAHFHTLAKALEEIDYAKIGAVGKEDFKIVLDTEIFKLTDDQYESLWNSLPVNEYGNLEYVEFLKFHDPEYIHGNQQPTSVARSESGQEVELSPIRPRTSFSQRSITRSDSQGSRTSRSKTRLSTPMVNADSAEQRLKHVIFKYWKEIQKKCRFCDPQNTGSIDSTQFKCILKQLDVDLSPEDFNTLMIKYDLKENGSFCYSDFLRHFVLDIKSRERSIKRPQFHPTILEAKMESANDRYQDTMKQIQATVSEHWKDMRRMFRVVDPQSTGVVFSDDFRHILRQFNVNLSEEEFTHMISYYDKNLDNQINYNDFIKFYLKH